jgi:uncharacterized membrane protein
MRQHLANPHAVLIYIVALIVAGYQAGYPYINPNNLQWQNAIIYSALAIISALVYGHHAVSVQQRLNIVEGSLAGGTTLHPSVAPYPPQG